MSIAIEEVAEGAREGPRVVADGRRPRRGAGRTAVALAGAMSMVSLLVAGCSDGIGTAGTAGSTPPVSSPASVPVPTRVARIVTATHVSGRMWDLTVDSPAVGAQVKVRLLLPARFDTQPARRWPVLYLLHGCCDTYVSWSRSTDIERRSRSLDAIVVMPDGGRVGFYSNWRKGPAWETFHLTELGRLLDVTYRASPVRVIAGVSMGGLGALGYAARHPGMFSVAASFSGIVDTRLSEGESQAYLRLVRSQGGDPQALWGDPTLDAAAWAAHNPYDLAPRLRGTKLFVSAGNGSPGPLDPSQASPDQTESALRAENDAFAQRLKELGVDATIDLYSPGTHTWVYWQREVAKAWPLITTGLGLR